MNHVIPNPNQRKALTEIYKLRYPTKNISILPNGLVVHRRTNSGSNTIGQVIVIDGWMTCFVTEGADHSIIWENLVEPAPTEMELLKERVAKLEKLVL